MELMNEDRENKLGLMIGVPGGFTNGNMPLRCDNNHQVIEELLC